MGNAIKKMSARKAAGLDGIVVEMLKVLSDEGKTILLKLLNNILKIGKMPKDFLKFEFVVIPKKPNAVISELLVLRSSGSYSDFIRC